MNYLAVSPWRFRCFCLQSFVYLFITPMLLHAKVLNIVITGCAVAAVLLFSCADVKYHRRDREDLSALSINT